MQRRHEALCELGRTLRGERYRFTTPTPETHARVLRRADPAKTRQDVFGWNRPFLPDLLPPRLIELLDVAACLEARSGKFRSLVRFSTLGPLLLAHSSFPTEQVDAVFFGPDTYRFARALAGLHEGEPAFSPKTIVDIGAGTGAGGLFCRHLFPSANSVWLADINRSALAFCEVNAALNGEPTNYLLSDVLAGYLGEADLIIANPPYLVDNKSRTYRHGGGDWGCELSARILSESLDRLSPQGRLLIYTGAPIVEGEDQFLKRVDPTLKDRTRCHRYEEIDVDVFGEELAQPPYDRADRIAAVQLLIHGEDVQ